MGHVAGVAMRDASETSGLQELSDPEFFAHWAVARNRLCHTPNGKPGHCGVKGRYDAVDGDGHQ